MKLNDFLKLVGFIFAVKAIFGVFYLLLGWRAEIAGFVMPVWLIVLAIIVDAILASAAFKWVKK